jgi:DNA topoisomerase-1
VRSRRRISRCTWEVDGEVRQAAVSEIAAAMKDADGLILATDPDREGEAISWHLLEVLRRTSGRAEGQAGRAASSSTRSPRSAVLDAMAQSAPDRQRRWWTPTWPAAPSTISSASRCRRCCGGSCPARARPAASSPWRCAWSADRERRDRDSSSPRGLLAASPSTLEHADAAVSFVARADRLRRQAAAAASTFPLDESTARRHRAPRSAPRVLHGVVSVEAKPVQAATRGPPFTTSTLQQEASSEASASRPPARCRSRSASMRTSTSAARQPASSPICGPTACEMAPEAIDGCPGLLISQGITATSYLPEKPAPLFRRRRRTRRRRTRRSARPTSSRTAGLRRGQ